MQNYYVNQVYSIENSLRSSLTKSFPNAFNPYLTSSKNYNLQDTCFWYYNLILGDITQQNRNSQFYICIINISLQFSTIRNYS